MKYKKLKEGINYLRCKNNITKTLGIFPQVGDIIKNKDNLLFIVEAVENIQTPKPIMFIDMLSKRIYPDYQNSGGYGKTSVSVYDFDSYTLVKRSEFLDDCKIVDGEFENYDFDYEKYKKKIREFGFTGVKVSPPNSFGFISGIEL